MPYLGLSDFLCFTEKKRILRPIFLHSTCMKTEISNQKTNPRNKPNVACRKQICNCRWKHVVTWWLYAWRCILWLFFWNSTKYSKPTDICNCLVWRVCFFRSKLQLSFENTLFFMFFLFEIYTPNSNTKQSFSPNCTKKVILSIANSVDFFL